MEQPFAVTYALEVIAIVVALLGVTNALYASILERTRELGVLRARGQPSGRSAALSSWKGAHGPRWRVRGVLAGVSSPSF